jgi:hypothetical protein
MEWQEIFLNNDEVVRHLQLEIREIFDRVFLASKEKTNATLFSTYDSEGGTSRIFLTPEAVDICANALAAYRPSGCKKPTDLGAYLAGDFGAVEHYGS